MIAPEQLESIVKRLAADPSDAAAWTAFYRGLWPFVFAVVYRRLRGAHDLAEDASQEVFIRLVRSRPFANLPDADATRAYVWRTADNIARDYFRHAMRRKAVELEGTLNFDEAPAMNDGSGALELREWLSRSLRDLPPVDREILMMVIDGYTLSEIAEATGLSYSNAGVRLSRLRARLRHLTEQTRPASRSAP